MKQYLVRDLLYPALLSREKCEKRESTPAPYIKQPIQLLGSPSILRLQRVGINVHGSGGLCVSQPAAHATNVQPICNEQRGTRMPQTMQG